MQQRSNFIVRCSSIGALMSEPQGKSNIDRYNDAVDSFQLNQAKYADIKNKETKTAKAQLERVEKSEAKMIELHKVKDTINLSKTCEGVVTEWMKEQLGYPMQGFSNKYTEKGLLMESGAIEFVGKYYGWGSDVKKNTQRYENEYITGEPDIELPDRITDIKCSFSSKTFPLMDTQLPIDGYGHQGMGYCALTGKALFQLTYALMDTPDHIIEREARKVQYDLGLDDLELELYEQVEKQHRYGHLPDDLRIKSFLVEYDVSIIESVYERVELCRKWIEQVGFWDLYEKRWFKV